MQLSQHPRNMKKYYRAALILVALISVVSLLFYRHEYNKLRYVLEVLNFFPGLKEGKANCSNANRFHEARLFRFNSPLPSWSRLNDDFYIYSAHRTSPNEINAIGFGKDDAELIIDCRVHFNGIIISGRFGYSKYESSDESAAAEAKIQHFYAIYYLVCKYDSHHGTPKAVSFYEKEKSSGGHIPLFGVKSSPSNLLTNASVVCVAPPLNKSISLTDMITFIGFHQTIGIENFIIYDHGVSTIFAETLEDFAAEQNLPLRITLLPWNFPYLEVPADTVRRVVEMDCLRRAYNKAMFATTMFWEEYLVSKLIHSVPDLLNGLERSERTVARREVETFTFCAEQKDTEGALGGAPMIMTKTRRNKIIATSKIFYISKPHETINAYSVDISKLSPELIHVNRYETCNDQTVIESVDDSISALATKMLNGTLLRSYIGGKLFPYI